LLDRFDSSVKNMQARSRTFSEESLRHMTTWLTYNIGEYIEYTINVTTKKISACLIANVICFFPYLALHLDHVIENKMSEHHQCVVSDEKTRVRKAAVSITQRKQSHQRIMIENQQLYQLTVHTYARSTARGCSGSGRQGLR
jgi:hypothetical protein